MKRRNILLFNGFSAILLFISVLCCTGCGLQRPMELSRRLIIEAIGVDKENDNYTLTLQTLDAFFGSGGTEGGDRKGSTKIYKFKGVSPADALSGVQSTTGLTPLYSQVKLLVFSKRAADAAMTGILEYFIQETNMRSDTFLCISRHTAAEIVSADLDASAGAASVLREALSAAQECGDAIRMPLYRFLSLTYAAGETPCCPLVGLEAQRDDYMLPALRGTAFFGPDGFAGEVNEETTRALAFLTNGVRQTLLQLRTAGGAPFSVRILSAQTRFRLIDENAAQIRIRAKCLISEYPATGAESDDALRAMTQAYLSKETAACFRLFASRGCDVCRLRKRAALRFPFRRGSGIPAADIAVEVELK